MIAYLPNDVFSFLLSFINTPNLSLTCKNMYHVSIKSYNELLTKHYSIIVRKNTIIAPCKIYGLINNIYHGNFDLNIHKLHKLIQVSIMKNHIELFNILLKTFPNNMKSINGWKYYLSAIKNGDFYIASSLLTLKNINYYTYQSVQYYYNYKTNYFSEEFMEILCNNTAFYNAIIYYSIYEKDTLYQKVITKNTLTYALQTAVRMCNHDALSYLVYHYKINNMMDLFNHNIHKDMDMFKLLIDASLPHYEKNLQNIFCITNRIGLENNIKTNIGLHLADVRYFNGITYDKHGMSIKSIPINKIKNYISSCLH